MVASGRSTNRGWLSEGVIRGNMLSRSILPGDEELGKKYDDHKPGASAARLPGWSFLNTARRWRRRRIGLALIGLYFLYLFSNYIPGLGALSGRPQYSFNEPIVPMTNEEHNQAYEHEPSGAPPGLKAPKRGEPFPNTYSGQIRFYRLAASLHGASHTNGYRVTNRNVLFAASNLKSASTLLPIICEMATWSRNWVHAAFMGREDIPIDDLLEINGIDKERCPAIWHDARPDYMEYSSDTRAESSVSSAMGHIFSFLHPQVAIMDDALVEDPFFVRAMRARTKLVDMPLIEMPKDHSESLMWFTRLDAGSLKNWHLPNMDILIQVPSGSSNVLRLLKSISEADYSGLKPPRITIELPSDTDNSVKRYLENFKWPPKKYADASGESLMTIRRRIANHHVTQEDSAIRFLELFYPTSTKNSHALLLSPQAQVSPQYFHYLKYAALEYRYSSYGEDDSANVMGVSLELPSVLLNGGSKLVPPKVTDMHTSRYEKLHSDAPGSPFLWQAPSSHATLFFGDKWAELHSFLSNRIAKRNQSPQAPARRKLVSEALPAWTEYMLEFMRARGYSIHYPATLTTESLVTIHNDLYHAPEEFSPRASKEPKEEAPPKVTNEPFLRAEELVPPPTNPELPVIPHSRPLHLALPFDGDLPEIPHLPYLLYDGTTIKPSNVTTVAEEYADAFRQVIGGCKLIKGKHRKIESGETRDLFCFGDEDEDDWEDDLVETKDPELMDVQDEETGAKTRTSAIIESATVTALAEAAPTETAE